MSSVSGWDWNASVVVGSGFVVSVLLLALVEWLRRTFATRQELNGVSEKFQALQTLYLQVRESADEARTQATAVQAEQKHQWQRTAEQVIRPLERITEKLEGVAETQAAQAAALDQIGRRLDRADQRHDAPQAGALNRNTRKRA